MATKQELQARAEELGLTVDRRRDGQPGEPLVADYEHAIAVAEGVIAPDPPPAEPQEKTYTVTGIFPVLGVKQGETLTVTVDPDGYVRDARGKIAAHPTLLVEQGAITELEEGEDG